MMNEMATPSFTKFPLLPPEIRLMIWRLAAQVRRVVTIDQNYPSFVNAKRNYIDEERPAMLSVCHESRQLALEKYQSVFKPPRPRQMAWVYNGGLRSVDLRRVLKSLHLRQKGTILTMQRTIINYMNAHRDEAANFAKFGKQRDTNRDDICPLWYNPENDVIFVRVPDSHWSFTQRLWSPSREGAEQVRQVAFELDRFVPPLAGYASGRRRAWSTRIHRINPTSSDIRFPRFSKGVLESVTLLLLNDSEVITIRLDETGLLKAGEWSYRLDLASVEFKEEMRSSWSGVTWRVALGGEPGAKLWNLLSDWEPNNILWEQYKREVCKDREGVSSRWHKAVRNQRFRESEGNKAELLPDGDGDTYLGPSLTNP